MIFNNFNVLGKKNNQISVSDADREIPTLGQWIMLENSVYPQVGISLSALKTNDRFNFCLPCEAEARHMYCFSGVNVVGGLNFCRVLAFRSFSQKL